MAFLKSEVEGEERISLAMKGFGLRKDEVKKTLRVKKQDLEISKVRTPTAAGLLTTATQELKKSHVYSVEGVICGKKHVPLMCEALDSKNKEMKKKGEVKVPENEIA
ncbi:hypothetical protein CDAR_492241 [Caerostris darwini]|uniref:Uncharacterized protein n=1 Tax=Caerostris darwini TaxID=1538125 RepID=A0AAV4UYH2_9ARAC|nr:hypothetical protein CDAR_492241 [Caerostris darwini]